MNDILEYSISWSRFFSTLVVCVIIISIYFLALKPVINRIRLSFGDQDALSFKIGERVIVVILTGIILVSFLLVNPLLHGFLLFLLLLITREIIVNVILGAVLIREFGLKEGGKIHLNGNDGVLYKLGWTGIHISSVRNIDFVSYRYLYRNGVSKVQEFVPSLTRIRCKFKKELEAKVAFDLLKGKIISYPFLLDESPPGFIVGDNFIEMTIGLVSTRHLNSLVDSLQNAGFIVEILENK